jgi:uncharacterized protein (TIGR02996 family)
VETLRMTEDDFLARIYAAPDDDEARLVYADWLQERKDPRGTFIALQFARLHQPASERAIAREEALLALYRERWLGPLWHAIDRDPDHPFSVQFERGFLATAALDFREAAPRAFGDPRWSTVRTLYANGDRLEKTVPHLVLSWLVDLYDVHVDTALALLNGSPARRLRSLGTSLSAHGPAAMEELHEALAHAEGLPQLRELHLDDYVYPPEDRHSPAAYDWLLASPLLHRLDVLCLHFRFGDMPDLAPWLALPRPRVLRLRAGKQLVTLRREDNGAFAAPLVTAVSRRECR